MSLSRFILFLWTKKLWEWTSDTFTARFNSMSCGVRHWFDVNNNNNTSRNHKDHSGPIAILFPPLGAMHVVFMMESLSDMVCSTSSLSTCRSWLAVPHRFFSELFRLENPSLDLNQFIFALQGHNYDMWRWIRIAHCTRNGTRHLTLMESWLQLWARDRVSFSMSPWRTILCDHSCGLDFSATLPMTVVAKLKFGGDSMPSSWKVRKNPTSYSNSYESILKIKSSRLRVL